MSTNPLSADEQQTGGPETSGQSSVNKSAKSNSAAPAEMRENDAFGPSMSEYANGKIIDGKYEILECIGSGGMAVVYKARHIHLSRVVAIKVLRPHLIDSTEFLKRFRKEAQVTSRLNHPNAVAVFDSGEFEGRPYLVMEFVAGRSLKRRIVEDGPRTPAELLGLLEDICPALTQAHALGIIHRDIKPDNVILTANNQGTVSARLVDFGIAKTLFHSAESSESLGATTATVAGTFLGTPKYAAPEQVLGKNIDGRTDIYSLGILLYEALTGSVPFDAPTSVELILRHAQDRPPPMRDKRPDMPKMEAVEALIFRCLEKDPASRFQTVSELLDAFTQAVRRDRFSGFTEPSRLMGLGALMLGVIALAFFSWSSPSVDIDGDKATNLEPTKKPIAVDQKVIPNSTPQATPTRAENVTATLLPPVDFGKLASTVGDFVNSASKKPNEPNQVASNNSATINSPGQSASDGASAETTSLAVSTATPSSQGDTAKLTNGLLPLMDTKGFGAEKTGPEVIGEPRPTPTTNELGVVIPSDALPDPDTAIESPLKSEAEKNFNAGRKLYHARRYAEAIPLLENAVRGKPKHIKARLDLANCYLRSERRSEALMQIMAALRIDANYPPANFDLACWHATAGNDEAALDALEKAIQHERDAKRWAKSDKDLARLRELPRFKKILGEN